MRAFEVHISSVSALQGHVISDLLFLLGQVPDYTTVIKEPMDLSTVMSRIDLHKYETVAAYLQDVDLIWKNALEYNPVRDPSGELRK